MSLMKTLLGCLVLSMGVVCLWAEDEGELRAKKQEMESLGKEVPGFRLKTLNGEELDLGSILGQKPVYFKFWATWCIPCRQQMAGFEELYQKYAGDFTVIAVNTGINENEDIVRKFVDQFHLSMPVVMDDGRLADALDLKVTPQHVLVDRKGQIAFVGHQDDVRLHEALKRFGREPANPISRNSAQFKEPVRLKEGDTVIPSLVNTTAGKWKILGRASKPQGLVFLSPWCEWYLEETRPDVSKACAYVREQTETLVEQDSMDWIGISTSLWTNLQDLQDYRASHKLNLPLILDQDSRLFHLFGISQFPAVVLLDENGKIRKMMHPAGKEFPDEVQKFLDEVKK